MNKQRKVLITTTYNEMGIIIDTKAEEVAQPDLQPTCNNLATDAISRQAAIDALAKDMPQPYTPDGSHPADDGIFMAQEIYADCIQTLKKLPSAQPEPQWILVNENQPEKYGWYLCSLKDGRVNTLYWHNRKGWIDNVRMHMFELYDIRSKLTGNEVKPENESVYWNDWVKAWMPLPEPYRAGRRIDD